MTHYIENFSYPYKNLSPGGRIKAAEKLTGLTRLSHFLVGTETSENLVDRATGYILDLLHIDYCRIFYFAADGRYHSIKGNLAPSDLLDRLFNYVVQSREIQLPSSPEQTLDVSGRELLDINITDSHWIIPLRVEQEVVGILLLAKRNSIEQVAFPKDSYYLVDLIADQLGSALHRRQINQRLEKSSIETVLALSKAIETRDPYCSNHSKRMASLVERIAQHVNLSPRETRELCWAALLHDIGKIGIEDQILHKPGPLTLHEWQVMKTHAEVGAQIVRGLTGLEHIASIILSHHERLDGTGYPHGLKGNQIPLGARIIAVVDSYSAMTEGRVYRAARPHAEAVAELRKFSGQMYDPDVVDIFIRLMEQESDL